MGKIPTNEYYTYKSAIEAANASKDKDALRQIQKELIARFSLVDDDVQALLRKFNYTV